MEFTLISSESYKTTKWSGGTTTQLFIYPLTANYQLQNFDFRLSMATVEIDKSEFSILPGISRKLMILEGEIFIKHENHHAKQLKKFDVDSFEGGWKTTSFGTCTDFNLMTKNALKSELSSVLILKNELLNYAITAYWNWFFVYVFSGKTSVVLDHKIHLLTKDNLLLINILTTKILQFRSVEDCVLVFSKIQ